MELKTAIQTAIEAAEYRAELWEAHAKGFQALEDELACFYESSPTEARGIAAEQREACRTIQAFLDNDSTQCEHLEPTFRALIEQQGVSIEVRECDCGFHIGIDATYLDQVGNAAVMCPSCKSFLVFTGV